MGTSSLRVMLQWEGARDEYAIYGFATHGFDGQGRGVLRLEPDGRVVGHTLGKAEKVEPLFRTADRDFLQKLAGELIRQGFGPDEPQAKTAIEEHLADAKKVRDRLLDIVAVRTVEREG